MRLVACIAFLLAWQAGIAQRSDGPCDRRTSAHDRDRCLATELDSVAVRLARSVGKTLEWLPDADRRTFLNGQDQWAKQQLEQCRTQIRGLSPGPEEDRIYNECRWDAAQKRIDFLDRSNASKGAAFRHGGCVGYDPDTVMLTGRLERRVYPNTSELRSLYLIVASGVCVTRNVDKVNEPTTGVTSLQLVIDSPRYASLVQFLGKQVTIRGTLSHSSPTQVVMRRDTVLHSFTVYQHAELLLHVVK